MNIVMNLHVPMKGGEFVERVSVFQAGLQILIPVVGHVTKCMCTICYVLG